MNGLRGIARKNWLWERTLEYLGYRREGERVSAQKANNTDYKISPESQAALDRGDRQRATGVYEDSYLEGVKDEDSLTEAEDASWFFDHFAVEEALEEEGRNHSPNVNED